MPQDGHADGSWDIMSTNIRKKFAKKFKNPKPAEGDEVQQSLQRTLQRHYYYPQCSSPMQASQYEPQWLYVKAHLAHQQFLPHVLQGTGFSIQYQGVFEGDPRALGGKGCFASGSTQPWGETASMSAEMWAELEAWRRQNPPQESLAATMLAATAAAPAAPGPGASQAIVAIWGLVDSYTADDLIQFLAVIDFEPKQMVHLASGWRSGAFAVAFHATAEARALAVAMEGLDAESDVWAALEADGFEALPYAWGCIMVGICSAEDENATTIPEDLLEQLREAEWQAVGGT